MLRTLFDTSVLIAAFEVNHPKHQICLPWLQQVQSMEKTGIISTHSLAEIYGVLTTLPVKPPISPQSAQKLITCNLERFELILLSGRDYHTVINNLANLGLTGSSIYDGLIAHAAIKSQADVLLTLNPHNFQQFGPEIAKLIVPVKLQG